MTKLNTADIIIIGGGVMGASTAYHLAMRGVKNIILLEKEEFFGTGATGRCAGGVRYQFDTEINIRLSLKSLPMLERFMDEIGQAIDYVRRFTDLFNMIPTDLVFHAVIETQNADEIEAKLHLRYNDKRVRGEWFNLTDKDVAEIVRYLFFATGGEQSIRSQMRELTDHMDKIVAPAEKQNGLVVMKSVPVFL